MYLFSNTNRLSCSTWIVSIYISKSFTHDDTVCALNFELNIMFIGDALYSMVQRKTTVSVWLNALAAGLTHHPMNNIIVFLHCSTQQNVATEKYKSYTCHDCHRNILFMFKLIARSYTSTTSFCILSRATVATIETVQQNSKQRDKANGI